MNISTETQHKIYNISLLVFWLTAFCLSFYCLPLWLMFGVSAVSFAFFWTVTQEYLLDSTFKNQEHFWYVPVYPVWRNSQRQQSEANK